MKPTSQPTGRLESLSREDLIGEVQRLERFKADFVVLLAQEIREPVSPLANGLVLLRQGADEDVREKALAIMERQVDRLNKLVEGLLELSRVTYGRIPLRRDQVDFGHLVRQVGSIYRATTGMSGLSLTVATPDRPVCVLGDPIRLMQVVAGLVENACMFTDRGGSVEVKLGLQPDVGQLRLQVRDSGMGIDPILLDNIFEPFCKAHRSIASMSPAERAGTVQILPPDPNHRVVSALQGAYAFDRVGEIFSGEMNDRTRGSVDNQHHSEHFILMAACHAENEEGDTSFELQGDVMVGNVSGKVIPAD